MGMLGMRGSTMNTGSWGTGEALLETGSPVGGVGIGALAGGREERGGAIREEGRLAENQPPAAQDYE